MLIPRASRGSSPAPCLRHEQRLTTFFFNEINRARPQVQSLLLRAMAERTVSAFNREYRFPFMSVFADRNRVEKEETFELASAARDRFHVRAANAHAGGPRRATRAGIRLRLPRCGRVARARVGGDIALEGVSTTSARRSNTVSVPARRSSDTCSTCGMRRSHRRSLACASRVWTWAKLILAGASPRGVMSLTRAARVVAWFAGRDYLTPDDVRAVAVPVLGHRVFFTPVYELRRSQIADALVAQILEKVPTPR